MTNTGRIAQLIGFMLLGFVMAACQSTDNGELPTLARFPTETPTSADVALVPRDTLPPTFTPTFTRTPTGTVQATQAPTTTGEPSFTPSPTITVTNSPTPTDLPTIRADDRPILGLLEYAQAVASLPADFNVPIVTQPFNPDTAGTPVPTIIGGNTITLPPPPEAFTATALAASNNTNFPTATATIEQLNCPNTPSGNFGTVYAANPALASQIGCALAPAPSNVAAAWQNFETGIMVWLSGEIYVFNGTTRTFTQFPDTFIAGTDPETSSETAPAGLVMPVRGFLKIWANNPAIRDSLGYGTNTEQGTTARVLQFGRGRMVELPGRQGILVLVGGVAGTWQNVIP